MDTDRQVVTISKKSSISSAPGKKPVVFSKLLLGMAVLALSFGGGWLGAESNDWDRQAQSVVQQRTAVTNTANLVSSIAGSVEKALFQ